MSVPPLALRSGLDFVVNRGLLFLQVRRLTRRERAALHALSDPLLLIPLAVIHFVLRQHGARATQ